MSESNAGIVQLPIDATRLRERMLVEVELKALAGKLQRLAPLRDLLGASGEDADARYRQILVRSQRLTAKLNNLTPPRPSVSSAPGGPLFGPPSIMSAPIAPFRWPGPSFGISGVVQMGTSAEGVNVIPPTSTGSIDTLTLWGPGSFAPGSVAFAGSMLGGLPGGKPDPNAEYVWLHNWENVVVFPAAPFRSNFTYSLSVDVAVVYGLTGSGYGATCLSFVSVGETDNFTGQPVEVNVGVGWPIDQDLPVNLNLARGSLVVQRSFFVPAGQTPAVALVMGVAFVLGSQVQVDLDDAQDCFVFPRSSTDGTPAIVHFRYDPGGWLTNPWPAIP